MGELNSKINKIQWFSQQKIKIKNWFENPIKNS